MKRSSFVMVVVLGLAGSTLIGQVAQGAPQLWAGGSAGVGWSIVPTPNPKAPNGLLNWDSCSSPVSCIAVGSFVREDGIGSALAERWDGSTWGMVPTPNPAGASASSLAGVSCRSGGCMAVGYWFDAAGDQLP